MQHTTADHHAHGAMIHHTVSLKTYIAVFVALLALTWVTTGVAYLHVEWAPFHAVAALSIAFIKATLVVLYFMHVKFSSRVIWLVVIASLFFFAILIALTFGDVMTRGLIPPAEGWGTPASSPGFKP